MTRGARRRECGVEMNGEEAVWVEVWRGGGARRRGETVGIGPCI